MLNPKLEMDSTRQQTMAVVIVGAVTAGKTTLAKKLAPALSLELITEETAGNYYHLCTEMNPRLHPQAIFDHCWIASETDRLLHIYDRVVLVALHLDETLLGNNYKARLETDTQGDFRTIEAVKQQTQILEKVQWQQKELFPKHPHSSCLIIRINEIEDYETAFQQIVQGVQASHP